MTRPSDCSYPRRSLDMLRWSLLVAIAGLTLLTVTPLQAATPTVTASPTVAATPSPTVALPTAPTNVHLRLNERQVTWSDNSGNETGFRIALSVIRPPGGDQDRTFTAAANSNSIELPADITFSCGSSITVFVRAFNLAGESAPSGEGVATDCGPAPSTPTPQLPATGGGAGSPERRHFAFAAVLLGTLGVGLAIGAVERRRGWKHP
jgi:hypothetical protein